MVVPVNLAGRRARIGRHDDPGTAVDGGLVRRQEELEQRGLVHLLDQGVDQVDEATLDRKSTRLNSSHLVISYAVFCLKKKSTRLNSSHLVISYAVFCLKKKIRQWTSSPSFMYLW